MTPEQRQDVITQGLQAAPSVLVVITTKVLEVPIESWLGICGIAFILLQAAYLIWKWRRDIKREREREHSKLPPVTTEY